MRTLKRTALALAAAVTLAAAAGPPPQQTAAPLRLGVIGLTHDHAWRILEDLSRRPEIELVGIAETIPELRQRARNVLGRPPAFYDTFTALLDEGRPRAVLCFADNRQHVPVVRACASRKIHVMLEKPLAPTYPQARAAHEAAHRAGIKLMINYWLAWTPTFQAAFDRVRAGDVGRVWRIHVRFGHIGPVELGVSPHFAAWLNDEERNGGGAIIDFGCYGANLLRWYLGKPSAVSAVRRTFKPQTYKVDDDAVIVATYPEAVGVVEASWNWPQDTFELIVTGDRAALVCTRETLRLVRGGSTVQLQPPALGPERQGPLAFFLDAIRKDRPIEGILGPDFNLDVTEVLDAAKLSARTGRAVNLPLRPAAGKGPGGARR